AARRVELVPAELARVASAARGRRARDSERRVGPRRRLGRQVVRKPGENLAPGFRHEHEILEDHHADAAVREPGLDRDHVAYDQGIVTRESERGRLVHLEADAVSERMLEAGL